MMGACLLLWCLGHSPDPASLGLTLMHDVRGSTVTERLVAYEHPWMIAGFVQQGGGADAVFAGALPVTITAFNGRVVIEGGAVVASNAVPHTGTHGNFMERVQIRVTRRLSLAYSHWSNASIGDSNPGMDALGIIVRLREH
jgi:Lipid A 3-O-deacylase (PagL)